MGRQATGEKGLQMPRKETTIPVLSMPAIVPSGRATVRGRATVTGRASAGGRARGRARFKGRARLDSKGKEHRQVLNRVRIQSGSRLHL